MTHIEIFSYRKVKSNVRRNRFSGRSANMKNRLYFRCVHHHMVEVCYDKVKKILDTVSHDRKDKVHNRLPFIC